MSRFRGNRCVRELMELGEGIFRPYAKAFSREPGSGHHRLRVTLRDGREFVVQICGTPADVGNASNVLRQRCQRKLRELGLSG